MGPPKVAGDKLSVKTDATQALQGNRTAAQALERRRRLSLFRRTDMLAHSALSSDYAALPTTEYHGDSRRLSSQYVRSTKTLLLDNNNSNMQVGYLSYV